MTSALFDLVDSSGADAKPVCHGLRGEAIIPQAFDGMSLKVGYLRARSKFAAQIHKARFPLAARIFLDCNPFKIAWQIVRLVAVKMVNMSAREVPGDECFADKAMNEIFPPNAVHAHRDFKVSSPRLTLRQNLALKGGTDVPLNAAKAGSFVSERLPRYTADPGKIGHLQKAVCAGAICPNFLVFHDGKHTSRTDINQRKAA